MIKRFLTMLSALVLAVCAQTAHAQCTITVADLTKSNFTVDAASFGALPDDSISDSVALQSALTAVKNAGGGTAWITRPGVYMVDDTLANRVTANSATFKTALTIASKVSFRGVPGVIIRSAANVHSLMNESGSSGNNGILIDGITWEGQYWERSQSTSGTSNLYYGHGVVLVNVNDSAVVNCTFRLFTKYALYFAKGNNLLVQHNHFGQRSDCIHINGPLYASSFRDNYGYSLVTESRFTKTASTNAVSFVQGEIVDDGFGGTGYFVSETGSGAGTFVDLYPISSGFAASGTITGLTSGATRGYASVADHTNGDNFFGWGASEGQYYRDLTSDAAKDVYNNLVDGVHLDPVIGSYQPIRLFGRAADTIRDNVFKNVKGKVAVGAGIALGDDTTAGTSGGSLLSGCVMRNNSFEDIALTTDGSNATFSVSGTGVKSLDIRRIRNMQPGTPMIVVTPGSGGDPALERLTVDGIETRATTAYMVHIDKGAGTATVTDLRLRNIDATIQGSNGCIIRNNGTITRLSISDATIAGSATSGAVALLSSGTVTDLALNDINFNPYNQTIITANGGSVTAVQASNITVRVQSATTGSRLMYIGTGGPITSWSNVYFDASSGFANHLIEGASATASQHSFTNLYTTGNGLRAFNNSANATMTVNVNGWNVGTHGGSSQLLYTNSASAVLRLTGSGYNIIGSVSTPVTATLGHIQVNNADFRCNASLLTGVQGDRVWSLNTASGPATAGPAVCETAGAPGVAAYGKNGRAF